MFWIYPYMGLTGPGYISCVCVLVCPACAVVTKNGVSIFSPQGTCCQTAAVWKKKKNPLIIRRIISEGRMPESHTSALLMLSLEFLGLYVNTLTVLQSLNHMAVIWSYTELLGGDFFRQAVQTAWIMHNMVVTEVWFWTMYQVLKDAFIVDIIELETNCFIGNAFECLVWKVSYLGLSQVWWHISRRLPTPHTPLTAVYEMWYDRIVSHDKPLSMSVHVWAKEGRDCVCLAVLFFLMGPNILFMKFNIWPF